MADEDLASSHPQSRLPPGGAHHLDPGAGVMTKEAAYWVEKLNLSRHPEGGYFRQTFRADELMNKAHLPERFSGPRVLSTAIYYLLPGDEVSWLHRLKADEVWHFHTGSALSLYIIDPQGQLAQMWLGANFERGEAFQAAIKAGHWFGAIVEDPSSYSLIGCTVSPGFEYEDFELGDRNFLIERYPQYRSIIEKLTKT
jgi:uncharacterized protein